MDPTEEEWGRRFIRVHSVKVVIFSDRLRARIAQSVSRLSYGCSGFDSQRGLGIFLFDTVSRPALWLTQPPIHNVNKLNICKLQASVLNTV